MRLSVVFVVLAVLFPAAVSGGDTHASVRVTATVPLIAAVEGPAQVVLAPGEVARIQVRVLANVEWVLGVHSPNASAPEVVTLSGAPGGMTANNREVEIRCSPEASGPQTIELIYTLMPR